MGFRLDRVYSLKFEGAMADAEVKIRSTSVATCLKIRAADDATEMAGLLAEHVVSWNLDDEKGQPLPITADAIVSELEEVVLAEIIRQWYMAAVGVTAPLDAPSTSGGPSPEQSIPMESLSGNQPS